MATTIGRGLHEDKDPCALTSNCVILSEGVTEVEVSYALQISQVMIQRLLKQFAAVILGCLLYFFVLMPHLPLAAQHQPFRLDWGLLVIAWVCLVLYGLIELVTRAWPR